MHHLILGLRFISLHIRSMWETICDAQAHSCTHSNSKFLSKFSRKPLSGISDQKAPPTPPFGKLHIWDDQSLLWNTPPPISENFIFEMTKVYSEIPPHFRKLHIWDDQSLLWNTPPFRKTSYLRWPKFTPKYPPLSENFIFEMTKVYSEIPPPFQKTSDLRWPKFTPKSPPPFQKTSDLRWPKFTPKYPPPISENSRFEMTKVYSEIPPRLLENPGYRMWRLICNPQGYHSLLH